MGERSFSVNMESSVAISRQIADPLPASLGLQSLKVESLIGCLPARRFHSHSITAQALVEFALILPIMLGLVMATLWLALFLVYRTQLQHVAQETVIAVAFDDCNAAAAAAAHVLGHAPDDLVCKITGNVAHLTVRESWPQLMPFLPSSLTAEARAIVRPTPEPTP